MRVRPRLSRITAAALATLGALAAAGTATARDPLHLHRCGAAPQCGALTVPRDRADATAGSLELDVERYPAHGATRRTVVLLAGGPGQAAIGSIDAIAGFLRDGAPGTEVVTFDQRGTGASALRCAALQYDVGSAQITTPGGAAAAATCAAQVGVQRRNFTTADSVADLEDLRLALGRPSIIPLGVSYGTLVATWYARTHPATTAGLVLDSVVDQQAITIPDTDGYTAARRALAELCAGRRCRGITTNLVGDVGRLEARLATQPLTGVRVTGRGARVRETFGGPADAAALQDLLGLGDLSSSFRGLFPAAVESALRGDPALLLRMRHALTGGSLTPPSELSVALLAATTCEDAHVPWTAQAGPAERRAAVTAAVGALDPAVFTPFAPPGPDEAASLCLGWPDSGLVNAPTAPLPDVPVLVFEGTQDLRTPVEGAQRILAGLTHATLVTVTGAGHSVLGSHVCALNAVRLFLRARSPGHPCAGGTPPTVAPLPPARLAVLHTFGVHGRPGRTLRAVAITLDDATQSEFLSPSTRFGGLRGGWGQLVGDRLDPRFRLHRYSAVPGVRIDGTITLMASLFTNHGPMVDGVVRVSGPQAARGRVRLVRGHLVGTLGGRHVNVHLPTTT
ncbi:MAG: alpha/beta hydrolase [Thermoleophilia bacterium]